MEKQYQKWVNLSYLVAAALLGYVVHVFSMKVSGTYDLEARFHDIDLAIRAVSVFAGAVLFYGLWRSEKVNLFMSEVMSELAKVTWPTANDTQKATVVVIIMVIVAGLFLGGLDRLWTWAIGLIL